VLCIAFNLFDIFLQKKAPAKPAKKAGGAAKKTKSVLDDSDGMEVEKPAKPMKKASAKKTKARDEDEVDDFSESKSAKKTGGKKTIEEEYTMLELREHVLKRPDTYIGSVRKVEEEQYLLDDDKGMILRTISYPPGLYKIFDEIMVNAADNFQRDSSMKTIRVVVDKETSAISVYNDGAGTSKRSLSSRLE